MLPAPQTEPKTKIDKRERISGRLKAALDLMVWGNHEGKIVDYVEAGRTVNLSARSMRRSLERPGVRRYLQEQKQVLRASLSSKSLMRLDAIADGSNAMAAVRAIAAIDGEDAANVRSSDVAPGVTIRIFNQAAPPAPGPVIELTAERQAELEPPATSDPIFKP